jgi:iron(III) transport system permease protein
VLKHRAGPGRLPRQLVVTAIAALFVAPGVLVIWRAVNLGGSAADTLAELREPAWRSVQLAVLVSLSAAVLGTTLAWLTTCSDLPGRRVWSVLLVLPIALPSFVGTTAILAGFTPGGLLADLWTAVGAEPPQRIRGLFPSWLLLTVFSYPFVLLPVAARLRALRTSLDESARLLGASPIEIFMRVTLPQIRAAIVSGALIVALYMLSEFGAVQLLGFDTLTRVIYATRQVDRATSFMAAAMLFAASLIVIAVVRARHSHVASDERTAADHTRLVRLGWTAPLAVLACTGVVAVGVAAPLSSLITWAARGVRDGRVKLGDLLTPIQNTAQVAVLTALIALLVVLPVAVSAVRHRDFAGRLAGVAIVSGFALPAIVIALSIAVLALNTPVLDRFYQTMPLLLVAYVVHFGSQALGSVEQGVRAVSPAVVDSGRMLESSWWRRLMRVELPLMRNGLVAGGGLVMLAVIKELPATLLLAPIGFRTLATDVWASFEEGFLADAAAGSLALITVSGLLSWLLVFRRGVTRDA